MEINNKEIDLNLGFSGNTFGVNGEEVLKLLLHTSNSASLITKVSYVEYLKLLSIANKTTIAENQFILDVLENNNSIILHSNIIKSIHKFINIIVNINMEIDKLKLYPVFKHLKDIDVILPSLSDFLPLVSNKEIFTSYNTHALVSTFSKSDMNTTTMIKFMITQIKHGKIPVFNS